MHIYTDGSVLNAMFISVYCREGLWCISTQMALFLMLCLFLYIAGRVSGAYLHRWLCS